MEPWTFWPPHQHLRCGVHDVDCPYELFPTSHPGGCGDYELFMRDVWWHGHLGDHILCCPRAQSLQEPDPACGSEAMICCALEQDTFAGELGMCVAGLWHPSSCFHEYQNIYDPWYRPIDKIILHIAHPSPWSYECKPNSGMIKVSTKTWALIKWDHSASKRSVRSSLT